VIGGLKLLLLLLPRVLKATAGVGPTRSRRKRRGEKESSAILLRLLVQVAVLTRGSGMIALYLCTPWGDVEKK